MKRPRFFEDQPLQTGSEVSLSETTSHHIHTVLRMQEGSELVLFNNKGGEYHGTLSTSHRKHCVARLETFVDEDRVPGMHIHLGQVMGKGDKLDWVIQKAAELGIREITPLTSLHSDFKLKAERREKKLKQWQQVAIAACEQCGMNRVPVIHPLLALPEWLEQSGADVKFLLHPASEPPAGEITAGRSIALAVGPEGGFADSEVSAARSCGFQPLELGPRILRTETAAITATAWLQGIAGGYS